MGKALLLDLGNHQLKVGLSQCPGDWEFVAKISEASFSEIQPILADCSPSEVRYSSVNPTAWLKLSEQLPSGLPMFSLSDGCEPLKVISHGTGSDRIISGFAAWKRCASSCVVADLGTAWTLDFVRKDGSFLGGAIGPGLGLQETALVDACPHLGKPSESIPAGIPTTTPEALAMGTRVALAHSLEGSVREVEKEVGPLARYLTGGDSSRMIDLLPGWEVCNHLVLEGLAHWQPLKATSAD